MPYIRVKGIDGLVYVPEEKTICRKNPCPDCFFCQFCSNDRCAVCLNKKALKKNKKVKNKNHS